MIDESQEQETAPQQIMDAELREVKEEPAGSTAEDSESHEKNDMSGALNSTLPGNYFIVLLLIYS